MRHLKSMTMGTEAPALGQDFAPICFRWEGTPFHGFCLNVVSFLDKIGIEVFTENPT